MRSRSRSRLTLVDNHYSGFGHAFQAKFLMQEMVEILQMGATGLQGSLRQVGADFSEWSLGDTYSLQHLAVQYNALTTAVL